MHTFWRRKTKPPKTGQPFFGKKKKKIPFPTFEKEIRLKGVASRWGGGDVGQTPHNPRVGVPKPPQRLAHPLPPTPTPKDWGFKPEAESLFFFQGPKTETFLTKKPAKTGGTLVGWFCPPYPGGQRGKTPGGCGVKIEEERGVNPMWGGGLPFVGFNPLKKTKKKTGTRGVPTSLNLWRGGKTKLKTKKKKPPTPRGAPNKTIPLV